MNERRKPELLTLAFMDYVCPFCYVAEQSLEKLRDYYNVKVNWCFLETDNNADRLSDSLTATYQNQEWQEKLDSLCKVASTEGVPVRDQRLFARSHQALLLAEAAKEEGSEKFYALHRHIFDAYNTKKQNIGDPAVLSELADQAGISAQTIEKAWEDPRYEEKLQEYQRKAMRLGVRGTPTFIIGGRALSGTLNVGMLLDAARTARDMIRDFI